jgi:hypothetical protein
MSKLQAFESSTIKLGTTVISNENIHTQNRTRSASLNKSKHRFAEVKPKITTRILKNDDNDTTQHDNNVDLNSSHLIR